MGDEPPALSSHRRRMAGVVARITLATVAVVAALGPVPGVTALPLTRLVVLEVAAVVVATLVLLAARRYDDRVLLWALRLFIAVGIAAVSVGVSGVDAAVVHGVGFMGFVLLLSAITLPPRDHLVALLAAAVLLVVVVLGDSTGMLWPVLASLAVGVLALVGMRAHVGTMNALEAQRQQADSASAALRAVVHAAGEATSGDVQEVFEAVTGAARRLGNDAAALCVLETDGHLHYGAARGVPHELRGRVLTLDEGLAGEVVRTGRSIVVADYDGYAHCIPEMRQHRITAAVGAPVRVDEEIVGVLVGARRRQGAYDESSVLAFELLANHAGRAIALARAVGEDRETLAQLRTLQHLQEEFVSTVSHELRTPLAVIDGAAETLVTHGDRLGPSMRETLLTRITVNARSLNQVVTGILEMARLDRGLAEFAPDPVPMRALVMRCVERLAPVLADHALAVDVVDATVLGDGTLLERVVDNLLVNAARHTPDGTSVLLRVSTVEDRVLVEVVDDGPGIPAHEIGHITERFRRAGSPTSRSSRGLGIGLALVDQVLRLHGARLLVESTVGEGTTFAFRLDALEALDAPDEERANASQPVPHPTRPDGAA